MGALRWPLLRQLLRVLRLQRLQLLLLLRGLLPLGRRRRLRGARSRLLVLLVGAGGLLPVRRLGLLVSSWSRWGRRPLLHLRLLPIACRRPTAVPFLSHASGCLLGQ